MDIDRNSMKAWVIEALQELGGSGEIVDVCKRVWEKHGEEITGSGDMFYKWQYEIRWAGDILRKEGKMISVKESRRSIWRLIK